MNQFSKFLLLLLFCKTAAFSAVINKVYVEETVDVISTKGSINLEGTTVKSHLFIHGNLKAVSAKIEQMEMVGRATLRSCTIRKKSKIAGSLIASSSEFMEELSLLSEKAIFNASNLSSIYIHTLTSESLQIIELNDKTVVHGPIIFESGRGQVILKSGSKVLGGVIGGTTRTF